MAPDTRYALTAGGDRVAFQVIGAGPVDVLVARQPLFPVDLMWDEPRLVHFLTRLSSFSRHIWFDPRGTGASDGIAHAEGRLGETLVEDMIAVADEVGCERVVVLQLTGVGVGLLFAATHPERTSAVVLVNAVARVRRADDYPQGLSDDEIEQLFAPVEATGYPSSIEAMAPSLVDDGGFRRWLARARRLMCPPKETSWRLRAATDVDLRAVLGSVQAPALVLYREGGGDVGMLRYVADHIRGAHSCEVPMEPMFFVGDTSRMLDAIEEFVTGALPTPHTDRVLATVLFTDLVDSTRTQAELGDRRWRELVLEHHAAIRESLSHWGGTEHDTAGDGFFASFAGPARAVRCACAIRDAVHALGVGMRAGVHTGEIERRDKDIAGIAVHVGQRVAAHAGPGEVLVSRTVADLITGSDIQLVDRGEHELRGLSGTWRLFSAHV